MRSSAPPAAARETGCSVRPHRGLLYGEGEDGPAHDRPVVWAVKGAFAAAFSCCLHRPPQEWRFSDLVSPAPDPTEKARRLPASTSDRDVLWTKLFWHTTSN